MDFDIVIAHGGMFRTDCGGGLRVFNIAKTLSLAGFNVAVVTPRYCGCEKFFNNVFRRYGVHIIPSTRYFNKGLYGQVLRAKFTILKAKDIVEKYGAKLQVEHSTLGGFSTLFGCRNFILDIHDLEFDGPLYSRYPLFSKFIGWLENRAVNYAEKIVVVSSNMKKYLEFEWGIPEDNISVVPNGCSSTLLTLSEDLANLKSGGDIDPAVSVSFVGVFTHNVDYNKVIALAKAIKPIKIFMIGDGPKYSYFINLVRRYRLNNIVCTGKLTEEILIKFLANTSVCINPRVNDFHTFVSFGVKNLYYAALKRAIVMDADGSADIFKCAKAAKVTNSPQNVSEFIKYVIELLDSRDSGKALGYNAYNLAKKMTWEKVCRKFISLYDGEI